MQITNVTPAYGALGSQVRIECSGVPDAVSAAGLCVLLSGSRTVSLDSFTRAPGGTASLTVTVLEGSQSGEFLVSTSDDRPVLAQSAAPFMVVPADGQPHLLSMTPAQIDSQARVVTLTGKDLDDVVWVEVGAVRIHAFVAGSDGTLRFSVPHHLKPGVHRVAVRSERYGPVKCPWRLTVA